MSEMTLEEEREQMGSGTIVRTGYTARELRELFPQAFERVVEREAQTVYERHDYIIEEIMASFKALFEKAYGVKLCDWSVGGRNTFAKVRFDQDHHSGGEDVANLTGRRAIAWLERNVYGALRTDWPPYRFNLPESERHSSAKKRRAYRGYGKWTSGYDVDALGVRYGYAPLQVPSCPLTGVCYDHVMLDALAQNVRDGDRLEDAFSDLARVANKAWEDEIEYHQTEDAIVEDMDANDWTFDEEGNKL